MTTDSRAGDDWYALVPEEVLGGTDPALSEGRARAWGLVLNSRAIPYRLEREPEGWTIWVHAAQHRRAADEIRLYEEENRAWPPRAAERKAKDNALPALSLLLLLGIFHNLTLLDPGLFGLSREQWLDRGGAHAGAIVEGQWWRVVTALTLHGDWLHLAGNLAIGALFVVRLCALLGLGWGWLLILTSGALGNLFNALLQAENHRAVGASTALFGTIGILCALAVREKFGRRRFAPLAAGAAMLGLLGSGGENTDLGAHLFGLLSGICLGLTFIQERWRRPNSRCHAFCAGLVALLLVAGAWALALRPPW